MTYYLVDPLQRKEYGREYYEGDGFSYRYQLSKKLFLRTIYIPWGPVCESERGFDNFLEHIKSQKFTHTVIELPVIYSSNTADSVMGKLLKNGFNKLTYTMQSDETLLVFKDKFHLSSSKMKRVRYGKKYANIEVKNHLTQAEIDEIYSIYLVAVARFDVKPVKKDVFVGLSDNCLTALARNKDTKELEGYLFCYFNDIGPSDYSDKPNNYILTAVYTGLTDAGRDHKLGHCMHYDLFVAAFNDYSVDIINFHGASRAKNPSYLAFKLDFTDHFHKLPGCYGKRRWL